MAENPSKTNRFNRLPEIADVDGGETVTLTQVLVLIVKDPMSKIPRTVFDHELPILRAIFGEENVVEQEAREVQVTNFTVAGEYERLVRNYEAAGAGVVRAVYGPNPRDLADTIGMAYKPPRGVQNRTTKMAQSLQVDNSEADTGGRMVRTVPEIKPVKGETFEAGHDAAGGVFIAGGPDRLPSGSNLPGSDLRSDKPTTGADQDAGTVAARAEVTGTKRTRTATKAKPDAKAKPAAKPKARAKKQ